MIINDFMIRILIIGAGEKTMQRTCNSPRAGRSSGLEAPTAWQITGLHPTRGCPSDPMGVCIQIYTYIIYICMYVYI